MCAHQVRLHWFPVGWVQIQSHIEKCAMHRLTSDAMDTIKATINCLSLFFHPSVVNVANQPAIFSFSLSSTFIASQSRMEPDNVCQLGTTAPGTHIWMNIHICGLLAAFHGTWVVMRSLHISSPNSICNVGVHSAFAESGESSKVLDVHLHFKTSSGSRGMDRRSGLGSGEREKPKGYTVVTHYSTW